MWFQAPNQDFAHVCLVPHHFSLSFKFRDTGRLGRVVNTCQENSAERTRAFGRIPLKMPLFSRE